jgi:hypothetical protein
MEADPSPSPWLVPMCCRSVPMWIGCHADAVRSGRVVADVRHSGTSLLNSLILSGHELHVAVRVGQMQYSSASRVIIILDSASVSIDQKVTRQHQVVRSIEFQRATPMDSFSMTFSLDSCDFHVRIIERCAATDRVRKTDITRHRVFQHDGIRSEAP